MFSERPTAGSGALPFAIDSAALARWRNDSRRFHLLDVRDAWELEICRFDGALHIPLGELAQRWDEAPRGAPLVVVCHHGVRSAHAVMFLRSRGVGEAVNLDGGIDAWARIIDTSMAVY